MFSTTGGVTRSLTLNPSEGLAPPNFAILGEDILTVSGQENSGTSFSTAIAAGLAGRLLDFSRHSDIKVQIPKASTMKLKHGMTKVLMAMVKKDGPYQCLKPWKLLPDMLRKKVASEEFVCTEEEKRNARGDISTQISNRLYDSWSPH